MQMDFVVFVLSVTIRDENNCFSIFHFFWNYNFDVNNEDIIYIKKGKNRGYLFATRIGSRYTLYLTYICRYKRTCPSIHRARNWVVNRLCIVSTVNRVVGFASNTVATYHCTMNRDKNVVLIYFILLIS